MFSEKVMVDVSDYRRLKLDLLKNHGHSI